MEKVITSNRNQIILASGLLFVGWMFYVVARGFDPTNLLSESFVRNVTYGGTLPEFLQSTPTFLHAIGLMFLFSLVCDRPRSFWVLWSVSTFGFELSQFVFSELGTFDVLDLLSISIVMPLGLRIGKNLAAPTYQTRGHPKFYRMIVLVFALSTSVASSGYPVDPTITHLPICMSKEEFRSAFSIDDPKPIGNAGKIYMSGDLLLVSEPFKGVHVFDNTNPEAPVPLAFITIPGNTDFAMKNGILYSDSASDLLTISFQGNSLSLLSRLEDVFEPRTPAEFSTENVYVPLAKLQECKESGGVVVGYVSREDGEAYERKIAENKK